MKRSFFVVLGSLSLATSLAVVACSDDDANVGSQGNGASTGGSAGTSAAGTGGTTTAGTGGTTAGTGGGAGAKTCGGIAGTPCGASEYCDYGEEGGCGLADDLGSCKPLPTECGEGCPAPEFQPCACDGQRYCNVCEINKTGLSVAASSFCQGAAGGTGGAGGTAGAGGSGGAFCGGIANVPCAAGEFCNIPVADACGAADGGGACSPKPTECAPGCPAPEFQPCACDGNRYCNTCEMNKLGLSEAPASFCKGGSGGAGGSAGSGGAAGGSGGKACGGFTTPPCAETEFCDFDPGEACGIADGLGTCKPKPTECAVGCPAPEFQPCACDGQTYCNTCEINKKGLSVAPASFCNQGGAGGAAGAGG